VIPNRRIRSSLLSLVLTFALLSVSGPVSHADESGRYEPPVVIATRNSLPRDGDTSQGDRTVRYAVSLARAADHLVEVQMEIAPGAPTRDIQLPVWNALYQVRDFAQYVTWVRAKAASGDTLQVRQLDKTTWRVNGAEHGVRVEYEIVADQGGPYGAQLNSAHAFLNLAEILMYVPDLRRSSVSVRFTDVPANWRTATALASRSANEFSASNYDRLVDGPVEIGFFKDAAFDVDSTHVRVVIDADPADYDMAKIVPMVKSIVKAEISWMDDRPMDHYLFIYHFPRGAGEGGMEHAYSTAIDLDARILRSKPEYLADVTAHEFFHLWNVKRIRPQSLEPIDYTRENYTSALWFSEGVTSTVAPYMLLRAGLMDEPQYLKELGDAIGALQHRPAHLTQSAEESSLDAWLEKYPYYFAPQRSISYYNKGEILGVMLDLQVREISHGQACLRDVFHWMNEHYAKRGKFFPDSEGVRQSAESVSHGDLHWFFQKYVAGTQEIPYDDFFKTVGLRLDQVKTIVADPAFRVVRSFDGPLTVLSVQAGSAAAQAGLTAGDYVLELNGDPVRRSLQEQLSGMKPGEQIHVKTRNGAGDHDLVWTLGSREEVEFELKDVDNVTPQQRARRTAWLAGEDQKPGDAHR
jgi:predicted metalloprotease with PDZ domain